MGGRDGRKRREGGREGGRKEEKEEGKKGGKEKGERREGSKYKKLKTQIVIIQFSQ
jgi:hypothetical protein